MSYVFWWLIYAIPCFFVAYCNGADMEGRLKSTTHANGFWKFYKDFFREGFHLFIHDYFGVYCPWSWKVAKRHRLADMRAYLDADGQDHDRLGHITAADCDNPKKQEAIARYTFISRTSHWIRSIFHFVFSPISGSIIIIGIVVDGIMRCSDTLQERNSRR